MKYATPKCVKQKLWILILSNWFSNEADSKSIEHQRFFIRLIRIFIFLACTLEIEEKDKKSYYKLRVNP